MFCKFCDHSVDCIRVDTIKDHLKSKKHLKKKDLKEAGSSESGIRQVSLTTITKSKDLREEFVLDFIKMSTMADIARKSHMYPSILFLVMIFNFLYKYRTLYKYPVKMVK